MVMDEGERKGGSLPVRREPSMLFPPCSVENIEDGSLCCWLPSRLDRSEGVREGGNREETYERVPGVVQLKASTLLYEREKLPPEISDGVHDGPGWDILEDTSDDSRDGWRLGA